VRDKYEVTHMDERVRLMLEDTGVCGDFTVIPTYFYYHLLHWSSQRLDTLDAFIDEGTLHKTRDLLRNQFSIIEAQCIDD
jgi:hypothetical protein